MKLNTKKTSILPLVPFYVCEKVLQDEPKKKNKDEIESDSEEELEEDLAYMMIRNFKLGGYKGRKFPLSEKVKIPDKYKSMGSLEFSKLLLEKSKVAVSPGIGFGEGGDHFVRFSLVENEHRIRQATRGIRELF